MKRKWLTVLVATLLVATALPLSGAKAADTALLGVSVPTLDDLFYTDMVAGAQAMADEMDMTLVVMSAENDAETELENVQALLEQDVALLLFSPVDVEESADTLTLLDEADVPVILVGEGLSADAFDVDVAGVVTPDEHLIGSLAAEAMCSALDGQGVVAEVVDGRDEGVALARAQGFADYMSDECPDVVLTPFDVQGRTERDAFIDAFSAWLKDTDVDGVLVLAQEMTLPALEASIIARVGGLTFVAFDGSEEALSALKQGRLQEIILPSGWEIGQAGVEMAAKLLDGEEVDAMVLTAPYVLDLQTIMRGDPRSGNLE